MSRPEPSLRLKLFFRSELRQAGGLFQLSNVSCAFEHLGIQARQETVAQQLKRIQVDFMIAADLWRETVSTREGSLRPVGDLSSLPRFIDHDGEACP